MPVSHILHAAGAEVVSTTPKGSHDFGTSPTYLQLAIHRSFLKGLSKGVQAARTDVLVVSRRVLTESMALLAELKSTGGYPI